MKITNYLFGHVSLETAKEVKDYPYGYTLRTSIYYWIETEPKKGDRFCSATRNPKTGRMNAPKKSTYSNIAVMCELENGHISSVGLTIYSKPEQIAEFAKLVGESNLNPEQIKQLRQLRGEKIVDADPITGDPKKDFKVKWEKTGDRYDEVRITFDRPDGVKVREIFEAMKTLNQERLNQVFAGWESNTGFGHIDGIVRICVRGGVQLGTVSEESYKEWLAKDSENKGE